MQSRRSAREWARAHWKKAATAASSMIAYACRTDPRRGAALQPSPPAARRWRRGTTTAQGGARAVHRCGRTGIAGGDVSRRPRASAPSASSTTTWSTSAIFSVRSFTARRMSGDSKLASARASPARNQPAHRDRAARRAVRRATTRSISSRLRRHRRRHRQLSDALSRQRRLRAGGPPERLRQHFAIRRAGVDLRRARRTVLPLPASRATTARSHPELRRRRRARRAAWYHRHHSSDRERSS